MIFFEIFKNTQIHQTIFGKKKIIIILLLLHVSEKKKLLQKTTKKKKILSIQLLFLTSFFNTHRKKKKIPTPNSFFFHDDCFHKFLIRGFKKKTQKRRNSMLKIFCNFNTLSKTTNFKTIQTSAFFFSP